MADAAEEDFDFDIAVGGVAAGDLEGCEGRGECERWISPHDERFPLVALGHCVIGGLGGCLHMCVLLLAGEDGVKKLCAWPRLGGHGNDALALNFPVLSVTDKLEFLQDARGKRLGSLFAPGGRLGDVGAHDS